MKGAQVSIRPAEPRDRTAINQLIHFESYVHRHLDWKQPLEWLGFAPFFVAEQNDRLLGALACPLDHPEIAWIRFFVSTSIPKPEIIWGLLWDRVYAALKDAGQPHAAALGLRNWFIRLLQESGFEYSHDVLSLEWHRAEPAPPPRPVPGMVRALSIYDLQEVLEVDHLAFHPIWRLSANAMHQAILQAAVSTIYEQDGQIFGYQISTHGINGVHLARLAVHPDLQNQGVGYALVHHLLCQQFENQSLPVTVNTQHDNISSLALYKKIGFQPTGESYPVYEINAQ